MMKKKIDFALVTRYNVQSVFKRSIVAERGGKWEWRFESVKMSPWKVL